MLCQRQASRACEQFVVVQKVPLEVLLDCSFVMKRREEEVQPQQGDEGTLWHLTERSSSDSFVEASGTCLRGYLEGYLQLTALRHCVDRSRSHQSSVS